VRIEEARTMGGEYRAGFFIAMPQGFIGVLWVKGIGVSVRGFKKCYCAYFLN